MAVPAWKSSAASASLTSITFFDAGIALVSYATIFPTSVRASSSVRTGRRPIGTSKSVNQVSDAVRMRSEARSFVGTKSKSPKPR